LKRRIFLKNTTLSALASLIGSKVIFGSHMPKDYIPLAVDQSDPFK